MKKIIIFLATFIFTTCYFNCLAYWMTLPAKENHYHTWENITSKYLIDPIVQTFTDNQGEINYVVTKSKNNKVNFFKFESLSITPIFGLDCPVSGYAFNTKKELTYLYNDKTIWKYEKNFSSLVKIYETSSIIKKVFFDVEGNIISAWINNNIFEYNNSLSKFGLVNNIPGIIYDVVANKKGQIVMIKAVIKPKGYAVILCQNDEQTNKITRIKPYNFEKKLEHIINDHGDLLYLWNEDEVYRILDKLHPLELILLGQIKNIKKVIYKVTLNQSLFLIMNAVGVWDYQKGFKMIYSLPVNNCESCWSDEYKCWFLSFDQQAIQYIPTKNLVNLVKFSKNINKLLYFAKELYFCIDNELYISNFSGQTKFFIKTPEIIDEIYFNNEQQLTAIKTKQNKDSISVHHLYFVKNQKLILQFKNLVEFLPWQEQNYFIATQNELYYYNKNDCQLEKLIGNIVINKLIINKTGKYLVSQKNIYWLK